MEIDVADLEFSYGMGKKVLDDISFRLSDAGLICIIGPNGVGKSTLVRCMNKILKPTGGTVTVDGRDISEIRLRELAQHMGYVPTSSEDDFPMTVFDTILLGRTPKQAFGTSKEDYDKVYDVMEMLGIEDLAMRPFNELSAGQHQKVAIARGLVQEPEVLILDEPTANLDVKHQVVVLKMLRRLAAEKKMKVVMIVHDLNISARYADRIILMSPPGIIRQIGTAEEVLTEENMAAIYGVRTKIITVEGKPHVIVLDDLEGTDRGHPCYGT
ncbi:ABC transporter ATP-binding protein [Methanomassiliicoccales archaeon LGM-DZ1]|nr:ABC transporter ATP-binding protein [Methanomassiliicoccales archaeon LGM-DZ1]